MSLQSRKYQLIEGIMQVTDEHVISKFEALLNAYQSDLVSISHLIKPMRKKTDVEQLVKEQDYRGVDKEYLNQLVEEIAIEESLEDLLKMD